MEPFQEKRDKTWDNDNWDHRCDQSWRKAHANIILPVSVTWNIHRGKFKKERGRTEKWSFHNGENLLFLPDPHGFGRSFQTTLLSKCPRTTALTRNKPGISIASGRSYSYIVKHCYPSFNQAFHMMAHQNKIASRKVYQFWTLMSENFRPSDKSNLPCWFIETTCGRPHSSLPLRGLWKATNLLGRWQHLGSDYGHDKTHPGSYSMNPQIDRINSLEISRNKQLAPATCKQVELNFLGASCVLPCFMEGSKWHNSPT